MASACSIVLARDPTSMMGGLYPGAATTDRLGSRASSCILMSVAVVCVCVMVVCGVFVLREYTLAQNYRESSCRLSNITYSGDVGCTHCSGIKETNRERGSGGSCAPSQLPCLHVVVSYRYNGTFYRTAMLYENSVQAVGAHSQCSFFVCLKTRDENQRAVDEYADRWRSTYSSSKFPCYYDADDQEKVIAHKTYTRWDVIHSMLWPSLVLVLCGALFLHLEARRRGLTFCGRKDEDEKASSAEAGSTAKDHHHHGNIVNFTASGSDRFNGSPSRDSLLQGDGAAAGRRARGDARLSKLSSSMSSLEKMSTRPGTGNRASPPIPRLGGTGGYTGVERMLKRKTASVDRLADVRVRPTADARRYAANVVS